MSATNAFPENRKMTVIFRIEPGSLGPDGVEHVTEFCLFAQTQLQACSVEYLKWFIEPRFDKSLGEINFQLNNKALTQEQAEKYLTVLGESYEHFEDQLENNLEAMIDQYFGR
jgi:hypothetical protein